VPHERACARLGLQRYFDQPTRMVLRNLERQPVKAALTIVGISSSCAILIMGLIWGDIIDYIVRVQYSIAQREDITVIFAGPRSAAVRHEMRAIDGVSDEQRTYLASWEEGT
jgi:putative ABC transport system permease protein